jgi:DNA-binding transcriptional ArsR family regulator
MKQKPIHPEEVENALKTFPSKKLFTIASTLFEALGDTTRMKILYALREQPLCVRDLAVVIGVTDSGISHQLRYLKSKRLVMSKRDGNVINYEISYKHVSALLDEAQYYAKHITNKTPDHPHTKHPTDESSS